MQLCILIDTLVNLEQELLEAGHSEVIISGPSGESGSLQKVDWDYNENGDQIIYMTSVKE